MNSDEPVCTDTKYGMLSVKTVLRLMCSLGREGYFFYSVVAWDKTSITLTYVLIVIVVLRIDCVKGNYK